MTQFVEGPTQRTLPAFRFDMTLDCALLDGPHGYPFPDLEYYYVYPHLREGALLILDDVHIPSIHRMLDILRADAMYHFVEKVGNTAFLRRSDAPTVDSLGNEWWKQGINRRRYESSPRREPFKRSPLGRWAVDLKSRWKGKGRVNRMRGFHPSLPISQFPPFVPPLPFDRFAVPRGSDPQRRHTITGP